MYFYLEKYQQELGGDLSVCMLDLPQVRILPSLAAISLARVEILSLEVIGTVRVKILSLEVIGTVIVEI